MAHTALDRLLAYLERSGLKRFQLADLLGIHETHLSKILSGHRRPGLDTAAAIEDKIGIPARSWSGGKRGRLDRARARKARKANLGNEISHASNS